MSAESKITLYAVFVIVLFLVESVSIYLIISGVLLVLLLGVPFRAVTKGWVPISLFLAFTFAGNAIVSHGKIFFSIGTFVITEEGFAMAGLRTARVFFMIMGAKILAARTTTESLVGALGRMMGPLGRLGLPMEEFFSTLRLTLKSLPLIKRRLDEACEEKTSGVQTKGFWNRMRTVSSFLIPLFVSSMQTPESFFEDQGRKKEEKSSAGGV